MAEKTPLIVFIVAFRMLQTVRMPAMLAANPHIMPFLNVVRINSPSWKITTSGRHSVLSSVRLSVLFRLDGVVFLKPFIGPSFHFLSLVAVTFLHPAFKLIVIAFNNEQIIIG